MEKVLIITVQLPHQSDEDMASLIEETTSLCQTAGLEVAMSVTQKRTQIHRTTYIGKGKLEEVKLLLEQYSDIELLLVNDSVSPAQIKHLDAALQTKIIDRTQLILDIFAMRAQSKEGQLQVALAQLNYLLPRLLGQGEALSRLGAGIGTRGPGETKLEMNRRHIRQKIKDIEKELTAVAQHRRRYLNHRQQKEGFTLALVGYTNAGKSTIFNLLSHQATFAQDLLFATLDPVTREVVFQEGFKGLLTDTVGFIQNLPPTLVKAFHSTLEEILAADVILHVVDVSQSNYDYHYRVVKTILKELGAVHIPQYVLFNKADLLTKTVIPSTEDEPFLLVSTKDKQAKSNIIDFITEQLLHTWLFYEVELERDVSQSLALLRKVSLVQEVVYKETSCCYHVTGYISPHKQYYINKLSK